MTLLTGRNGAGKTTVLEAVRVYAARARPNVLHDVLEQREEFAAALDEDQDPVVFPDYAALLQKSSANGFDSCSDDALDTAEDARVRDRRHEAHWYTIGLQSRARHASGVAQLKHHAAFTLGIAAPGGLGEPLARCRQLSDTPGP